MEKDSKDTPGDVPLFLHEAWFDPIEAGIRDRIRGFIEELVEDELSGILGRTRYQRPDRSAEAAPTRLAAGYRNGRRERQLLGSFGLVTISVPRARLDNADGTNREWRSLALPRYARMTKQVEALIAGAYLSGTNTRRVRRALGALFKGAVSKDTVSGAVAHVVEIGVTPSSACSRYRFMRRGQCIEEQDVRRASASRRPCA